MDSKRNKRRPKPRKQGLSLINVKRIKQEQEKAKSHQEDYQQKPERYENKNTWVEDRRGFRFCTKHRKESQNMRLP